MSLGSSEPFGALELCEHFTFSLNSNMVSSVGSGKLSADGEMSTNINIYTHKNDHINAHTNAYTSEHNTDSNTHPMNTLVHTIYHVEVPGVSFDGDESQSVCQHFILDKGGVVVDVHLLSGHGWYFCNEDPSK